MSQAYSAQQLLQSGLERRREGRLHEAQKLLLDAVLLEPELFEAACELGRTYRELADLDAAVMCFEQCTDLKPDSFDAQFELARTLLRRGRPDLAVGHYQCALLLQPHAVSVLQELAIVYQEMQRAEPALELYRRAIELAPERAGLRTGLASALLRMQDADGALRECERALELEPNAALTLYCLGEVLFALGRADEAVLAYEKSLALAPDALTLGSLMYTLMYAATGSAGRIFEQAALYDRLHVQPLLRSARAPRGDCDPERRLRIGYVSPDFRHHCQANFTTPVFAHHDRKNVEVHCYSTTDRADDMTEKIKAHAEVWHDVRYQTDDALAQKIRSDGIDILIDLTMHMSENRALLFARKPAPVQVCWLAYPGTAGNGSIDYRITDPHIDPPGLHDHLYIERSLRLPDTFWCYDPLSDGPDVGPLPAAAGEHITFGCLNNFVKTNRATFELWAAVLRAVPSSRLVLLSPPGETRARIADVFSGSGVAPERIAFFDRCTRAKYLELYRGIDVGLDTIPYNGHTTTLDAAWMGVPVVTLLGSTVVGRAGLCLAKNLDLPELVAHSPQEFVERAVALVSDRARLASLRAGLRERLRTSPLMDGPRFVRNLEALYRDIWRSYCRAPT